MIVSNLLLLAGTCIAVSYAAPQEHSLVYSNLALKDRSGNVVGKFTLDSRPKSLWRSCMGKVENDDVLDCRETADGQRLIFENEDSFCTKIKMAQSRTANYYVPLGDANWYGGGEEIPQKWPLEKHADLEHAMVTMETGNRAIQDPVWFNSQGVLVYVMPGAPLFMQLNTTNCPKQLCLTMKLEDPYRPRSNGFDAEILQCKLKDAKEAFKYAVDKFLGKPTGYPDERMIQYPVWSTWAKYKADINDSVVRDFAKQIKDNKFENSQLEIDDAWETCYGSKIVDTKRFPNMKQLTDDLKKDGFRVTIWTHPFIQNDCDTINEAEAKGFLAKNESGIQTHWWNGYASIVDFTNRDAAQWFTERHEAVLKDNGIDGFKFDAGEISWNPILAKYNISADKAEDYPNAATSDYIRTCAKFNSLTEVRSAYRTQNLPIFLRMVDKDSRWGDNNGLKSLVTTLLQMNMVGYSMVLPDMIGGNQYNGEIANQELFLRWLQANTFMPALQYALVPWDYKETELDTVTVSKKFNDLHATASKIIIAAMKQNVKDGSPVNPPIWWIDPTDKDALAEDSEYLLGDSVLVAPVLEEGKKSRNVYLPKGSWRDGNNKDKVYEGPTLINDYSAPLDTLPYFIIKDSEADKILGSGCAHAISSSAVLLTGLLCTMINIFLKL